MDIELIFVASHVVDLDRSWIKLAAIDPSRARSIRCNSTQRGIKVEVQGRVQRLIVAIFGALKNAVGYHVCVRALKDN